MSPGATRRAYLDRRGRFVLALTLLAVALGACETARPVAPLVRRPGEGRFVLYFNGPSSAPVDITLEIAAIEAVREDGARVPVLSTTQRLNSVDVVDRQLLLAETFLPHGTYTSLVLRIGRAQAREAGRVADLAVRPEGFPVDTTFRVRPSEATTLFMSWDVGRSIEREVFLRPAFGFEGQVAQLRGVMAYVTNEVSDSVAVIDRSSDRVVAVIDTGKRPRGIAIAPDTSRAFVVNAGSHTLTVIDLNTNRVLHTANLEAAADASDIAITPDGKTLYVVNTALGSVSAISSSSFQIIQTIPVGQRPAALALGASGARLLVANSGSNTISVIDTPRNTVAATIPVEFEPASVAVDSAGTQAFVAHLGSPRLAIISLSTLRVVRTAAVGYATSVLPDPAAARIFVSRTRPDRLSLFDLNVNAEIDAIDVGATPTRVVLDPDRDKLYVVSRDSDAVTVIDRTSRRVKTTIPAGRSPYAIATVR